MMIRLVSCVYKGHIESSHRLVVSLCIVCTHRFLRLEPLAYLDSMAMTGSYRPYQIAITCRYDDQTIVVYIQGPD